MHLLAALLGDVGVVGMGRVSQTCISWVFVAHQPCVPASPVNLLLALLLWCVLLVLCSFLCRTLDLYTSAVLEAVCDPPSGPAPEWRDMMKQLSKDSCEVRGVWGGGGGG